MEDRMYRYQSRLFVLLAFCVALMPMTAAAQWREFNSITGVEKQSDGVVLLLQHGALLLQVCSEAIIRVTLSPTGKFPATTDYVVVKQSWAAVPWKVEETDRDVTLTTAKLRVVVTRRNGAIDYYSGTEKLVTDENRW